MNFYKNLRILLISIVVISIFSTCVKDGDFETPNVDCSEPQLAATTTIQQVKEMYTFGGAKIIETDIIIEGYVVSSDKSGNIYKSISIQDKPENPTAAIKISINQTNIYTKYNVGRKIYVKLKGLVSVTVLEAFKLAWQPVMGWKVFCLQNSINIFYVPAKLQKLFPKKWPFRH